MRLFLATALALGLTIAAPTTAQARTCDSDAWQANQHATRLIIDNPMQPKGRVYRVSATRHGTRVVPAVSYVKKVYRGCFYTVLVIPTMSSPDVIWLHVREDGQRIGLYRLVVGP